MSFADPYFFVLLAVIPVLILVRARFAGPSRPATYSHLEILSGYKRTWRVRLRWLPGFFRVVALSLLVIGLARPQIGQAKSELPGQGIDIVLVLDTSSSMSTPFGKDSRLVAAQRVINNFIQARASDRIGLVIFRDESLVLSPLTLDYEALQKLVSQVQQVNLSDGTAIGVGLADATNLMRDSRARSRVAILLTDGQNNNTTVQPLAAARIAQTLGVRLYTIGVIDDRARGTGGAVDEKALKDMAELTGGHYYAAENEQGLSDIYTNIDTLEKSQVGRTQFAAFDEFAVYFLAAGLAVLAFELVLQSTLWRRLA